MQCTDDNGAAPRKRAGRPPVPREDFRETVGRCLRYAGREHSGGRAISGYGLRELESGHHLDMPNARANARRRDSGVGDPTRVIGTPRCGSVLKVISACRLGVKANSVMALLRMRRLSSTIASRRRAQHVCDGAGDRPTAGDDQHMAIVSGAHVVERLDDCGRETLERRHARGCGAAFYPGADQPSRRIPKCCRTCSGWWRDAAAAGGSPAPRPRCRILFSPGIASGSWSTRKPRPIAFE